MDPALKHRLIGAAVLSALAIIFLPMLIVSHDRHDTASSVPLTMPSAPGGDFQTKELPLVAPTPGVSDGGVVGMNATHPAGSAAPGAVSSPATSTSGAPLPSGPQPAPAALPSVVPPSALVPAGPVAPGEKPPVTGAPVVAAAPASTAPLAAASPAVNPPAATAPPTIAPLATPTAPIPAASAGGHYVVSLGTYANAANAQSLVASLKGSQLPAYSESVSVAGKQQTRVRIGPFGQRGDAEAARLKAQQVRKDMPASVTALDSAAPPADASASLTNKAVPATPAAGAPSAIKPGQPVAPPATSKQVAPTASATASGKLPVSAPAPASSTTLTTAAKPAAPSPAAAGRGYAVQVSAYRTEEEALTLRNKLRAAGFTAFSERVQVESGTMYRVRIGPEADRDGADKLRAELSSKMGLSGMVVGYP